MVVSRSLVAIDAATAHPGNQFDIGMLVRKVDIFLLRHEIWLKMVL